jgi:alanyl-tRNA synthetase
MDSADIRARWLKFFESNNSLKLPHTVVPSASLIADDPNLLLVNAGMVPFKPYFLGEVKPPYKRATSVQKCVRTLDIDEVGKTTRHASFFQMCGNFSFGDYFKEGAISLAWELLTKSTSDGGYGFSEDKLWVTVYQDDDEAAQIWEKQVGVPKNRIQRRGMADNFWSMGVPGPCGPCSEIYFAKRADQSLMKIDTLKFGTWCSCKTLEVKVEIRTLSQLSVNCLLKILTLALVLNELLRSYKVLKIFMKLIPPESFLIKHPS